MYPESLLWWLGGIAVLVCILVLLGMLVLHIDHWLGRHDRKKDDGGDDG